VFKKILIANRGEIACRVTETAQSMGIRVVAVYSDADAMSKHVAMADEAVHIGGVQPAESYLRGDRIIEAALATGAEAIHPGYGFLSENPDFVAEVEAAGLVFIGPSAEAIRAMGLKDAAKAVMEEAGVPVVPGYHGGDQSDARLAAAADEIGYPVLIKAVAGGGGKGMRLVESESEFEAALASARAEARTAFGNADVLIEKYITAPRHIEVQVFGDGQRAVHLFERDCSLQRRHQKVIEEAPAPGMTDDVRAAMGEAAVRAAEAIGYKGAGTIEFIVDGSNGLRSDGFWFMEMNTRLQVEHPVTEAITGVDLVEWQLRVAAGEALPMQQEELSIMGHAFEARLYAEDVPAGFLPATGTLDHLAFSSSARNDSGVRQGDTISPFYDPMIAKVITHGATRDIALARMAQALSETEIAGTVTNLSFLSQLCAHQGFARGLVDTGLIARDITALTAQGDPDVATVLAAFLVAGTVPKATPVTGFALWSDMAQQVGLRFEEEDVIAAIAWDRAGARVRLADTVYEVTRRGDGFAYGGRALPRAVRHGGQVTVFATPAVVFDVIDQLDRAVDGGAAGGQILSPMPGLVRQVLVGEGERVTGGQKLLILEAMKMEHSLTAPRDGIIEDVFVQDGDQVEAKAVLVQLEDEG
jgi:3-methylcrotonyl-CoA carboxylase alpha subunit